MDHKNRCHVCHKEFVANRVDAKYCSNACRQKAYRDRQPKKDRREVAAAQLAGRRATTHKGKCSYCGRTFYTDGTGTGRLYCNNACRQAAYRERKRTKLVEAELRLLRGE